MLTFSLNLYKAVDSIVIHTTGNSNPSPKKGAIKKALYILSIWVGFGWWESEDI